MIYKARHLGIVYEIDIEELKAKYPDQVEWLLAEAKCCRTWAQFEMRTGHGIFEFIKRTEGGDAWKTHPLSILQADLRGGIGVRSGEMSGELNSSFCELTGLGMGYDSLA